MTQPLTDKQKEIVSVAKHDFCLKGYAETSMRDLAENLKIKAASIYYHFTGKEEILRIICDEIFHIMKRICRDVELSQAAPMEKFLLFIKLHLESVYHHLRAYLIYRKYHSQLTQVYVERYKAMDNEYFQMAIDVVKSVVGETEQEFYDENFNALYVLNILNTAPRFFKPNLSNLDPIVQDLQRRICHGLQQTPGVAGL